MIIKRKKEIDLPFEANKSYKTKFASGEMFFITKIRTTKDNTIIGFIGIYENSKHLGECPLNIDRLIPQRIISDKEIEIEVCSACQKECECKTKYLYNHE